MSAHSASDVVKGVEAYVQAQQIDAVIKRMVVSCLTTRPDNVPAHM